MIICGRSGCQWIIQSRRVGSALQQPLYRHMTLLNVGGRSSVMYGILRCIFNASTPVDSKPRSALLSVFDKGGSHLKVARVETPYPRSQDTLFGRSRFKICLDGSHVIVETSSSASSDFEPRHRSMVSRSRGTVNTWLCT